MKIIEWCDKHKWTYILAIIGFIVIPILIEFIPVTYGKHSERGDWLSFWGSYLGIIPAGLITYFMYLKEREIDRNKNKSLLLVKDTDLFISQCEEIINYIDELEKNINNAIKNGAGFLGQMNDTISAIELFHANFLSVFEKEIPSVSIETRENVFRETGRIVKESFKLVRESNNDIELPDSARYIIGELKPIRATLKTELIDSRKNQLEAKRMILN